MSQRIPTGWIYLATIAALAFVSCSARASSVADIRERGELVMLSFPHQESSFIRVNLKLGAMPKIAGPEHFEGIDVDLMSAFAEELGVVLKIKAVSEPSYKRLVPDLLEGKGDLIASSFSVTESRSREVDFSLPYYSVVPVVVARRGMSVASLEDLAGKRAVVVSGSSNHSRLEDLGIVLEKTIKVDFMVEVFDLLLEGEADFTLLESPVLQRRDLLPRDLEVVYEIPDHEDYGIAVPRGSDLREELDAFLLKMKENGQLAAILDRHLDSVLK